MSVAKQSILLFIFFVFFTINGYAGGSIGLSPALGVKVLFQDGENIKYLPFRFELEGFIGKTKRNSIGASFSYDLGIKTIDFISIAPEYKYYLNPSSSSFYLGVSTDIRFKNKLLLISPDLNFGYQVLFSDKFGFYLETNFGYTIIKNENASAGNSSGIDLGARMGFKFLFGN